uniref:Bifunctional coenzyme A synthase n=1 Tax=Graphocephala atropunctata TaxID=36148 RepID=A0A1B6MQ73_9HEMI
MMKTGMLVISNPNIVHRVLPMIQREIKNTIYIQYFPATKWNRSLNLKSAIRNTSNWPTFSSSIVGLYSKALPYKHLDVRVLLSGIKSENLSKVITINPVEVVYYDKLFSKEDMLKYVGVYVPNKTSDCQVIALSDQMEVPPEDEINKVTHEYVYENVVLGGTFDRLHYGHKIMLSEAILRCKRKITVGVTDTQMLKSKKLWELVEPCDLRMKKVRDFLEEVEPSLEYDIVPINDIFGPTKDDPTFQMIVVSSETRGGGGKINEIRAANELNPLCIHEVELLADVNREDEVEEAKISSSNLRLRCLGTLLRPPQPNATIPARPYIVGLMGGIASGKSNIGRHLGQLGVAVVDCDQLAHHVYRPGTTGHRLVVEQFSSDVLDQTGVVDRKKLGAIVFNDKEQLDRLSALIWPLILEEAQDQARTLHSQGHEVVVLEAAVLLRAGWTEVCHEVWATIVPPTEAIKRLMERNGLSEEEAKARLESQPTNTEYVERANVVFCSLWQKEFTQKQVDRAWTNLKERLNLP